MAQLSRGVARATSSTTVPTQASTEDPTTSAPTIEVVEKKDDKDSLDSLWGLAWEVESIKKAHERLTKEGVKITDIKNGLKDTLLTDIIYPMCT